MCALVTGVQTCALPICARRLIDPDRRPAPRCADAEHRAASRPSSISPRRRVAHLLRPRMRAPSSRPNLPRAVVRPSPPQTGLEEDQRKGGTFRRAEEQTSELQSQMRISYAVSCLKKKKKKTINTITHNNISTTTNIK